ncbi:MAG: tetratricopeptide repeat protein [Planctomycetaceae bacterium]
MAATSEADALCQQARESIRRRKMPEAIALYQQALQVDERNVRAHEGIATAAFLSGDYELAEQHFKRLSMLDSKRADPLVNLGAVYNRREEWDAATRALRQALSKNPKCAEAYYNLGIAYRGKNQASMAISAYKEAIRFDPQMSEAYQNLANAYVEMGNLQQAILNFQRALQINPGFDRARRGLEVAQQKSLEIGRQANPFGRLVDVDAMQQRKSMVTKYRNLTDEERLEDRASLHSISRRFEAASHDALDKLQHQLIPALLSLAHAIAQGDDKRMLSQGQTVFAEALDQHRRAIATMSAIGDELELHEQPHRAT